MLTFANRESAISHYKLRTNSNNKTVTQKNIFAVEFCSFHVANIDISETNSSIDKLIVIYFGLKYL